MVHLFCFNTDCLCSSWNWEVENYNDQPPESNFYDTNRKLEVHRDTRSALKRRRMLQFEDQPETSIFTSESFSAILKSSARDDTFDELLPEGFHLIEGFSEDASTSSFEGLDLYAEEWYNECLNDAETPILPDDLSFGCPDVQVDISEYLNVPPETETSEVQRPVTRSSPNVIFKYVWFFNSPNESLGFILADHGFHVWVGNVHVTVMGM